MRNIFKILIFLSKFLPKKVLKEIKDRNGKLYFRRSQILNLFFWKVCIHEFWQDWGDIKFDKDEYLHNHPHEFWTYIVENGYIETYKEGASQTYKVEDVTHLPGHYNFINFDCFHYIKTLRSFKEKDGRRYCKTITIAKRQRKEWGYLVDGKIISNLEFRKLKKDGKLN